MSHVIGIDLGTTNSCVAVLDGDQTTVIPNAEGSRTTPSIVAFGADGECFVGQIAKRQAATNPKNTVYSVKRLIGRRFDDPEVAHAIENSSYPIVRATNDDAWVSVGPREYAPAEISALVLGNMKQIAEDFLGERVTDAVITVPAYFNDGQRQATRDAGRIAGLNVLRVINEPTAASLAYGFGSVATDETIAVYDLGGGTFDISILHLGDGLYEVLATNGDTYLGGEDFDAVIVDMLASEFQQAHGVDPRTDPMALQRLKEAAERAKHELSVAETTDISLPFLTSTDGAPLHLNRELQRTELETLCMPLADRTLEPCRTAMADAGLKVSDITQVVLVGGMTRMPLIHRKVTDFFKKTPNRTVNPDEVVAVGAAIQGGVLCGDIEEVILLDVTPLSLGIETMGGIFTKLLDKNSAIPCQASEIFTTTIDNQDMVSVHVLQGERELASGNHSLARFELYGIPPAPRGQPQIEVTFNIDVNGLVSVSARDMNTGQEQIIRVVASGGLNEREIENMIAEAAESREADVLRKQKVELGNKVKGLMYTTDRSVKEYAAYLKPAETEAIDAVIAHAENLIRQIEDVPLEALHEALGALEESAQRIGEAMYAEMMYNPENKEE
ncbi:MAG: molecular chaperone DnaK [Deltaproteobacteria bacterium CG2_30_63_29]|nr:MAG: molecular chaperone DnaK [Deltaproteobacteria bacterium CG2_30_63_29]PIV99480.1 MAG: molecular chaperone DnaK [Deltaproteobacteria bacterium CG17_big_fil_post_rev_8_21_14_2_50_63_7]